MAARRASTFRLSARNLFLFLALPQALLAADLTIYGDALDAGWENWSWSTTVNFASTAQVHGGTRSTALTMTGAWAGFYLHSGTPLPASGYTELRFWIHGGSGGQVLRLALLNESQNEAPNSVTVTPQAGQWTQVIVPLTNFGAFSQITGFYWIDNEGNAQPTFYLDDVVLVENTVPPPPLTMTINVTANRKAIDPLIYGMNFADVGMVGSVGIPIRRWGGNATTRYNWQNDTSNRASDYYFENIPADNTNPGALPFGSDSDEFVAETILAGADPIITVPLIGWTPKTRGFDCGFSIAKYGAQQDHEYWRPDCGNGYHTNGTPITGNDPTDSSIAIDETFVTAWINHLKGQFGTAAAGGVRFYALDNEPMLWDSTHRDVHPLGASYDEVFTRGRDYATAIKNADSGAFTLGPVLWGWTAYLYSAKDITDGGAAWWNTRPDRMAHGDIPFVPWYLQQMQSASTTAGRRLLDYLDIHYYPQGAGLYSASAGNAATQALRLRSTRSLWDPTYTDESWIAEPVMLIPRMKSWISGNYPGTKLAITEYNFGALGDINGALAQADILGIFGREGVDLATLWDPPAPTEPGAHIFRLYLNYDGAGHAFGNTSVQSGSSDQSQLSVYAAQRSSDSRVTAVVINKTGGALSSTLTLQNFGAASTASVYRYSPSNLSAIVTAPDVTVSGGQVTTSYPARSVTLLVFHPASGVADWSALE